MANPNPKSSTGISHGTRSPSISVGVVDHDRIGKLGQPAVDWNLEREDDHDRPPVLRGAEDARPEVDQFSSTTASNAQTVSTVYSGIGTCLADS